MYAINYNDSPYSKEVVSAPTQALLQRWLREVHNIVIVILPYIGYLSKRKSWAMEYMLLTNLYDNYLFEIDTAEYHSYEEALEEGLEGALDLIKDES